TQETARQNMQKEIIERLPNLNFEQMREVRQLIERLYPTFFQVLSQASKKIIPKSHFTRWDFYFTIPLTVLNTP
ncbi:hypothetical protein JO83_13340, partial [Avibacterium paragallinarum]